MLGVFLFRDWPLFLKNWFIVETFQYFSALYRICISYFGRRFSGLFLVLREIKLGVSHAKCLGVLIVKFIHAFICDSSHISSFQVLSYVIPLFTCWGDGELSLDIFRKEIPRRIEHYWLSLGLASSYVLEGICRIATVQSKFLR